MLVLLGALACAVSTQTLAECCANYGEFAAVCRARGGTPMPNPARCLPGGGGRSFAPQPPPPPDPNRTWVIDHVSYTGEFYIVTRDGRRLAGQNAAKVTIDAGARAITGPSGHAVLTLPDGSTFTIGPGSEIALDSFVYEPGAGVRKVTMNFVKGFFRWVTGTIAPRYKPTVKLPVGDLGFRGTDVECVVEPGGSGYIRLYSGELDLQDYDTAQDRIIRAGETVRFENFKVVP